MKTYAQHLAAALASAEIAVRSADLRRVQYDAQWVYISRIGKKPRILTQADAIHNGGKYRNAIKITWNPETYTRQQMERHVRAMLPAIAHFATMGSVHPFRRCSEVALCLVGGVDTSRPGYWTMIAPANVDTRKARLSILGL